MLRNGNEIEDDERGALLQSLLAGLIDLSPDVADCADDIFGRLSSMDASAGIRSLELQSDFLDYTELLDVENTPRADDFDSDAARGADAEDPPWDGAADHEGTPDTEGEVYRDVLSEPWTIVIRFDPAIAKIDFGEVSAALALLRFAHVDGMLSAEVVASIEIEGAPLVVSISLPNAILTGSHDVREQEPVDEIAWEEIGLEPPTPDPLLGAMTDRIALPTDGNDFLQRRGICLFGEGGPQIVGLSFAVAPLLDSYALSLDIRDVLTTEAVDITRLNLMADYHGGLAARATGLARADMTLRPRSATPISVTLDADLEDDQWRFYGSVDLVSLVRRGSMATSEAHSATLADAAALVTSAETRLPGFLEKISLDAVAVGYGTRDDAIAAKVALGLNDAQLVLEMTKAAAGLTASGTLRWPDAKALATPPGKVETRATPGPGETVGPTIAVNAFFPHKSAAGSAPQFSGRYTSEGAAIDLPRMIATLAGLANVPADMPAFRIDRAGFHVKSIPAGPDRPEGEARTAVFALAEITSQFDLSALADLPLVGALIPTTDRIGIGLTPVVTWPETAAWYDADNGPDPALKAAFQDMRLPEKLADGAIHCVVEVSLGGSERRQVDIAVPNTTSFEARAAPATANLGAPNQAPRERAKDDMTWLDVNKSLGPLHVSRLGFATTGVAVTVGIDAGISLGGVSLQAQGLGFEAHLMEDGMSFALEHLQIDGFGIDLDRAPLAFSGAFLRSDEEFLGAVTISTEAFALHAVGALQMLQGAPSMFLFGVLDYPIGGPPFFFVKGLAAGFGLHRRLTLPPVSEVRSFPLVAEVLHKAGSGPLSKASTAERLASFSKFIQPKLGEYFFAAGVQFTSFKLVDGFLLLVARASEARHAVEIDLVGAATFDSPSELPPGAKPIAHVEMDLTGHFAPAEGVVSVMADVNNHSYIFDGACALAGQFAFASWFGASDHAGDFVLSIGGYKNTYKRPQHYPDVARVTVDWKVSDAITVNGSGYFALTPQLVMAGLTLDAHARIDDITADFSLTADFELGWEPFHYEVSIHLEITASWGWFSTTASAALDVWGPPFSGSAHVKWTVISFDIVFGERERAGLTPIDWPRFETAFLADKTQENIDQAVLTFRVESGLLEIRTDASTNEEIWVVDPETFAIAISSKVPARAVATAIPPEPGPADGDPPDAFGIAPMAVSEIETSLGVAVDSSADHFLRSGRQRRFPAALWGRTLRQASDAEMIKALGEIVLKPGPALRGRSLSFTRALIDAAATPGPAFSRRVDGPGGAFHGAPAGSADAEAAAHRQSVLAFFGIDETGDGGVSAAYAEAVRLDHFYDWKAST